jgi:hypothetical protein
MKETMEQKKQEKRGVCPGYRQECRNGPRGMAAKGCTNALCGSCCPGCLIHRRKNRAMGSVESAESAEEVPMVELSSGAAAANNMCVGRPQTGKCKGKSPAARACPFSRCGVCCDGVRCSRHTGDRPKEKKKQKPKCNGHPLTGGTCKTKGNPQAIGCGNGCCNACCPGCTLHSLKSTLCPGATSGSPCPHHSFGAKACSGRRCGACCDGVGCSRHQAKTAHAKNPPRAQRTKPKCAQPTKPGRCVATKCRAAAAKACRQKMCRGHCRCAAHGKKGAKTPPPFRRNGPSERSGGKVEMGDYVADDDVVVRTDFWAPPGYDSNSSSEELLGDDAELY